MRTVTTALVLAVFTLGLGACKGGADSVAEDSVKMMEQLAGIIETNKADCDKMGDSLDKLISSKQDLIKKAMALRTDKEKSKKLEEKYGPRLKAATKKMIGGAMKCATNKKVAAALKKLSPKKS